MIIPQENQFNDKQFKEVSKIISEFNCELQPITGTTRTIYAIKGDERHQLMINRLEGLHYISRVDTIQSTYKLMDLKSELANQEIRIGGCLLKKDFLIIAGHCTIDPENPRLFIESAHAIKEAGAHVLRGGVWKPRTSPHSYQGDSKAFDTLLKAKQETGLPINTEVMDVEQLKMAIEAGADMIQVGARNALNYLFLKEIGSLTKDKGILVLLKRGMHMGTANEFISAAEYIASTGNPHILLCPRGTAPAMDGYRNYPDESITPILKQRSWAPVVVDPSHSVGKAIYVPHAAMSAASYGADGICIECNSQPSKGIGDDPKQAITPELLKSLIVDLKQIYTMRTKYEHYLHE